MFSVGWGSGRVFTVGGDTIIVVLSFRVVLSFLGVHLVPVSHIWGMVLVCSSHFGSSVSRYFSSLFLASCQGWGVVHSLLLCGGVGFSFVQRFYFGRSLSFV